MASILVVDDSFTSRKLMKKLLTEANHEVIAEAENGEMALIEYKKHKPDIVTMDMDMPGIGGMEAASQILTLDPSARIIIVSAHTENEYISESKGLGVKRYISKPINKKLIQVIDEILNEEITNKIQKNEDDSDKVQKSEPEAEKRDTIHSITKLKVEDTVTTSHYSTSHFFNCTLIDIRGDILFLRLSKELSANNFFENDPIVIGYKKYNELYVCGCTVVSIEAKNIISVKVDTCETLLNKRVHDLLPVSLYENFKGKDSRNEAVFFRYISMNQLNFSTKADFMESECIEFNITLVQKVITLTAEIISKEKRLNNYHYELAIEYRDINTKRQVLADLKILTQELERAIRT